MKKQQQNDEQQMPIRRQLGINLVKTFNWVYDRSQLFFAEYGLTSQQYNVIKILYEADRPISTSEVLDQMVEKNAGVSRLVDRLVIKKLVQKKTNAVDKRLIDIQLTPSGESLCEEVTADLAQVDQVYAGLSDKDVAELNRLLDKIRSIK